MSNYNFITINNFFTSCNSESPLSSLSQNLVLSLEDLLERFKDYPLDSLTCATITVKPKKTLSYYEQLYKIEKQLKIYDNDRSNNKTEYIGFLETTKGNLPHIHLLIYNGYRAPFIRAFKVLGQHNTNKLSFQPVTNVEKYIKYITKDHKSSNKYYRKIHMGAVGDNAKLGE